MNKKLQIFLAVLLTLVLSIGIFFGIGWLVKKFETQPPQLSNVTPQLPNVSVRSDVPGYKMKIQNEDKLSQFLIDQGFWNYEQNGQKVKKLEIVYTDAIQPLYQSINKDKKVESSYDITFKNGILTEFIQIDPSSVASTNDLGTGVQQYFLYMIYDFVLKAKPDEQTFYMTNLSVPFFTLFQ